MLTTNSAVKDSLVVGQSSQGAAFRASLVRLTRYSAVFEIYSPGFVLRLSEVLAGFSILMNDRKIYSGRAVVSNLVNAGTMLVCEVTLDESALNAGGPIGAEAINGGLPDRFQGFLEEWQKLYRVVPEFKIVIADLQSFLVDLRLWLEQVELEIRPSPSADRAELEQGIIDDLAGPIIRSIDMFIDQFETIAATLEPEQEPVHRTYLRRQLHPLLLCSPFAYRTFHKPLGYAGDYEAVEMMLRPPYEGGTLFGKIINVWLLGQSPAAAHRNRVALLTRKLVEETVRRRANGNMARVFNLGCGPAEEVQRFLREERISDRAQFTLVDFNEETLQHLRPKLEQIKTRRTPIQLARKSVHQILKEAGKSAGHGRENQFDFIYCAGLFDYLSDQVCQRLMNILYDQLAPGGLLLGTNVSAAVNRSRPFRYSMEYILDWHLNYRDAHQLAALAPSRAASENVTVVAEDAGVNLFVEVRKPNHA